MDNDRIMAWLDRKLRAESRLAVVLGMCGLGGGVIILGVTWCAIHIVCLYSLSWILGHGHWACFLVPTLMIPLLFWGNARTSQEYLSEYTVTSGIASNTTVAYRVRVSPWSNPYASTVHPLAPDTVQAFVKIVTDCLYIGPRIVTWSLRTFAKAVRLRHIDVPSCTAVIAVLADAGHRMSFQEIADAVEGMNLATTFRQLQDIDGVLFLTGHPAGLTLGSDLKSELPTGV